MPAKRDIAVLRELAGRVADVAALPVQQQKRSLWRNLNALRPDRPMVMIDQVCWSELSGAKELDLRCEDPECRSYERSMRRLLYQWDHFRADMVVEPHVPVPKAVTNTGFGIEVREDVARTDPANPVVSHKYRNQFQTEDDLEKIRIPRITHDESETARRLEVAQKLFDGLLEVRCKGVDPYLSLWDPIAMWMGVEAALYALIDSPDYMHRLVARMTDGYLSMLDQLESRGLLCGPQPTIHCSGAYTHELPEPGYDPEKPRTRDIWAFGLAQMFATVSPRMFQEFEVAYAGRIFERFGLVYYGCCDPLDRKMDQVRNIPNVRKVSISPWSDQERGAEQIGSEFVFSRKPNPAMLAADGFDARTVRADLEETREICRRHGCPLELILKDLSTVRDQPQRLEEWACLAMEVVGA